MQYVNASYAVFKQAAALLPVYYVTRSVGYFATCLTQDTSFRCDITESADIADFDATIKPTATAASKQDDAVALSVIASVPLPLSARSPVKIQPYGKDGANYMVVGRRFVATLDADTNMDLSFSEDREIQSADAYVADSTDGDYMGFFMMAPIGPGGSLVAVLQWGETIFVKEKVTESFASEVAKEVPAGLVLRLVYHSVAASGNQPVVKLNLVTWV